MHRIPRRALRAAMAVAASALWGIGMAAPAAACDVVPVTFETADLVLTGTVVQREDPAPLAFLFGSPDDLIRWTLTVDGQEKGATGRRATLLSPRDPACGLTFVVGQRYRILAATDEAGRMVVAIGGAQALDAVPERTTAGEGPMGAILLVGASLGAVVGAALLLRRLPKPTTGERAVPPGLRNERALEHAREMFERALASVRHSREVLAQAEAERRMAAAAAALPAATRAASKPRPKPRAKPRAKPGAKAAAKAVSKPHRARSKAAGAPKPAGAPKAAGAAKPAGSKRRTNAAA